MNASQEFLKHYRAVPRRWATATAQGAGGPEGAGEDHASAVVGDHLSEHTSPRPAVAESFSESETISAAAYEELYEQYQVLAAEAQQWREQHEQYAAVVEEWAKKVEELEEARYARVSE